MTVEDSEAESDPLNLPVSGCKKKRGAQIGHRGKGRKITDSIPSIEVIHDLPHHVMRTHLHSGGLGGDPAYYPEG